MRRVLAEFLGLAVPLALIIIAHVCVDSQSEPFFYNDETRHVMTGVFVRDAIADCAWRSPRDYAVRYYLQYPALGLMVWPPVFYGVEGVWMTFFGTSFLAAKLLVAAFGIVAGISFYRLLRRHWPPLQASLALMLFGLSPLMFAYSRQVMLEIPCLAIALTSIFHFERYLDGTRRSDAWLACVLAALAALTRFDGVFLLPFFGLRLLMTGNLRLLKRGSVMGGILLALLLTGPYYWWTWQEYGSTISQSIQTGTNSTATGFLDARNFLYYPSVLPEQVGWFVTIAAVMGIPLSLRQASRRAAGPFFALMIATYLTFTPMAEMDARHAIYWIPALAYFAVAACFAVGQYLNRDSLTAVVAIAIAVGTAHRSLNEPHFHVIGYEQAAQYVVRNSRERPAVLIDGFLNGDFIYQIRRNDPERHLWVLRGDKVFYSMLSDPTAAYAESTKSEAAMLERIEQLDPELIVLEEPQLYFELPAATMLRQVIRSHPEQFRLEEIIPIRSDHFRFANARLEIWRKRIRNPNHDQRIEIEMLNLRRSLGAEMKR